MMEGRPCYRGWWPPRCLIRTIDRARDTLPTNARLICCHQACGQSYDDGILYEATFDDPGQFAPDLGEDTMDLNTVNGRRDRADDPDCL